MPARRLGDPLAVGLLVLWFGVVVAAQPSSMRQPRQLNMPRT
jgi:hypothetical protein